MATPKLSSMCHRSCDGCNLHAFNSKLPRSHSRPVAFANLEWFIATLFHVVGPRSMFFMRHLYLVCKRARVTQTRWDWQETEECRVPCIGLCTFKRSPFCSSSTATSTAQHFQAGLRWNPIVKFAEMLVWDATSIRSQTNVLFQAYGTLLT